MPLRKGHGRGCEPSAPSVRLIRCSHSLRGEMVIEAGRREWEKYSPEEAESCAMSDYLVIGGWNGRQKVPVQVITETPDGFWIKPEQRAFVPGRGVLKRGQRVLVPRNLIKLDSNEKQVAPRRHRLLLRIPAVLSKAWQTLCHPSHV